MCFYSNGILTCSPYIPPHPQQLGLKMAESLSLSKLLQFWLILLLLHYVGAYTSLSDDTLQVIPTAGKEFDIEKGSILAPILIPRVPGTRGSTKVLNHMADFFKINLPKWDISFQNSTSKTPATGNRDIPFVNIIATRDPPWASNGEVGHLTMVAHYDSKLTPAGFIGATDSAASCAMLMYAASAVDVALTKKWETMQKEGIEPGGLGGFDEHMGLQILFLDGEEAFVSWTDTDSLYGARALAEQWETTFHPAMSTYQTPLSSISLFVLLDLLGEKNPTVPSYFKTTHWAYRKMAALEKRLRSLHGFMSSSDRSSERTNSQRARADTSINTEKTRRAEHIFLPDADKDMDRWLGGMIEDDHIPFMQRGVEVLHIIPTPFPRVWHELDDDAKHLDMDTVVDWTKLMTAFMAEWMDLEGFFDTKSGGIKTKSEL